MKIIFKILFFIFIFSLNGCSQNNDVAEIFFFDVNQGDSSFVEYNGTRILIDTGDSKFVNSVISTLKDKKIKSIDYVILSHDHADHVSGFMDIYNNFKIKNLVLPDTLKDETFNNIEIFLKTSGIPIHYIKKPTNLKLSNNFSLKFLSTLEDNPDNINDASLVFSLSMHDFDILYTGDIEEDGQLSLLNKNIKSEILKVPHHGAFNNDKNNVQKFLNKVSPLISVISSGDNSYGHPNKNTLKILESLDSKVLRTDEMGTIHIKCNFDKDTITISGIL